MNARHRRFELQCVQASCGQLSGRQLEELREHAADCDKCRTHLRQLAELNLHLWSAAPSQSKTPTPRNMTERFVLRAIHEGVPLSHKSVYRPASFAFALPTMILVTLITAVVAWHGREGSPREVASTNASPVAMGRSSVRPATPEGDKARDRHDVAAIRRLAPPDRSRSRVSPRNLPSDSTHPAAFFFANDLRPGAMQSTESTRNWRIPASTSMAPALAAWLERRSSPRAWASFTYRRNCDSHDEALPGVQPWSIMDRNNPADPPVFCFDPKIALVADSKLPESITPHWNRLLESPVPVFISAGNPAVTH